MLCKFMQARVEHPDTIDAQGVASLLMSTISGAGDTTAATVTVALYCL
jgi:hypothetical protein